MTPQDEEISAEPPVSRCIARSSVYTFPVPGKRKFDEQLAALDTLRHGDAAAAAAPLRKALGHRNNFVVAKAADIAREFELKDLTSDLLSAFERFFDDPVKSDPQCWAKNAISKTLASFELQEAGVFLRGLRHIQLEPVWGGVSDSAGTLRSTCAHALVQVRGLRETELLQYLLELFADKDKSVRAEAARAIETVNSPAAALLLRLRASLGSDEPEILGACYAAILGIEGKSAIPWVARFLDEGDDLSGEAALAIAGNRSADAFQALKQRFEQGRPPDEWFRSVLLSAIALTRQDEAISFLLDLVSSRFAEAAVEALLRSGPNDETIAKLEKAVAGNAKLTRMVAARQS